MPSAGEPSNPSATADEAMWRPDYGQLWASVPGNETLRKEMENQMEEDDEARGFDVPKRLSRQRE
jgi:hypothetical protein